MFFKTCKSVLRLTKECRSLSYDAMCAQTAIIVLTTGFCKEETDMDLQTVRRG